MVFRCFKNALTQAAKLYFACLKSSYVELSMQAGEMHAECVIMLQCVSIDMSCGTATVCIFVHCMDILHCMYMLRANLESAQSCNLGHVTGSELQQLWVFSSIVPPYVDSLQPGLSRQPHMRVHCVQYLAIMFMCTQYACRLGIVSACF